MNKDWKDRLTNFENWKREGMNTFWVAAGLIGGSLIDRGVQKALDKWLPDSSYAGYIKSGTQIIAGLTMSVLADPTNDRLRLIGYGVSGAGTISALRLIPGVDKLFSENVAGLGKGNLLGLNLGDFGAMDNIRQISTSEAKPTPLDLPELIEKKTQEAYSTPAADSDEQVVYKEVFAQVI